MFSINTNGSLAPLDIFLLRPDGSILCSLNHYIDETSASLTINLNQQDELSFSITTSPSDRLKWFDSLQEGLYLMVERVGLFKMKQPTISRDGIKETKQVTASSCEVELEDISFNLEINMGTETSMERLVDYDDGETEELLDAYTGIPKDWIVLYNTFPEQLTELAEKYDSGYFGEVDSNGDTVITDEQLVSEIESIVKTIPRLKNSISSSVLTEYVVITKENGTTTITLTALFRERISSLISFYTKYRDQLSLISLAIDGTNGNWSVGDIYGVSDGDYTLANKKFQFEADTNVYAFLTQDVARASKCIVWFDTIKRRVNVTPVDAIGQDSGVVISYDDLLNKMDISSTDDQFSTQIYVKNGDNFGIEQVNFGLPYIYDLTYKINAVDADGDRIYVSDEVADAYNEYVSFVDEKREEYIALSRQILKYDAEINELKYRVPLGVLKTDWTTYTQSELEAALKQYHNLLLALLTLYKEDYGDNGVDENGDPVTEVIKESPYWNDYVTYTSVIDEITGALSPSSDDNTPDEVIEEGVAEEIVVSEPAYNSSASDDGNASSDSDATGTTQSVVTRNSGTSVSEIKATLSAWETEWQLYGLVELQAKISSIEQVMSVLAESSVLLDSDGAPIAWSNLTDAQKAEFGGADVAYQYDVYKEYYDAHSGATAYLAELTEEISGLEELRASAQQQRIAISKAVQLQNYFDEDVYRTLSLLLRSATYSNDNIFTTSIDSSDEKIDRMLELLEDAKERASIVSRPQLTFNADTDNLLALIDYKACWDSFNVGNFILVQYRDDTYVSLRLVSYTFNPAMPSGSFSMVFSNYTASMSGRTDLEYLLGLGGGVSSGGSGSSGSGSTSIGEDTDAVISNTMLTQLLESETFGTRVRDVVLDTIDVKSITAKQATFAGLNGGTTKIDAGCVQTGKLYDAVYRRLVNNGTIAIGSIENTSGSIIDLDTGKFNLGGKLKWNGSTLSVEGAVIATTLSTGGRTSSGTGIAGIYIDASGNMYAGSNNQTRINADGTFNFGNGQIVFNGTNVVLSANVDASNITAGHVAAENITGTTISGKTISGGSISIGTGFSVNSSGVLTATGANVSGEINADSGKIGGDNGWNITTNKIYTGTPDVGTGSGDITLSSSDFTRSINGTSRSWLRFAVGSNFGISKTGALYTAGATISGNITATTFRANGSDSDIYCTIGDQIAFYNNKSNSDVRILYGRSVFDDTTDPVTYSSVGIYTNSIAFYLTGGSTGYITYMGSRAFQIDRDVRVDRHLEVYGDLSVAGNIYDKNGSTVTGSDFAIKNTISSLEREKSADFIYSLNPVSFKYNEGTSNRLHHGFIAQDVKHSMGEDDWGVYVEVALDNSDDTYIGLRYGEFIADIVATLQTQNDRISELERI